MLYFLLISVLNPLLSLLIVLLFSWPTLKPTQWGTTRPRKVGWTQTPITINFCKMMWLFDLWLMVAKKTIVQYIQLTWTVFFFFLVYRCTCKLKDAIRIQSHSVHRSHNQLIMWCLFMTVNCRSATHDQSYNRCLLPSTSIFSSGISRVIRSSFDSFQDPLNMLWKYAD